MVTIKCKHTCSSGLESFKVLFGIAAAIHVSSFSLKNAKKVGGTERQSQREPISETMQYQTFSKKDKDLSYQTCFMGSWVSKYIS